MPDDNTPQNIWHVTPTLDQKEHVTDAGVYCHCEPSIEHYGDGTTVIHNAYDGREFSEQIIRPSGH